MPRYIALLRGINVGGNTMIKMSELKAAFEECGFENVVTYINSGNIAFDVSQKFLQKPARSKGTGEIELTLVQTIEQAIKKHFDKQIPVMIRGQSAIVDILENNPFAGQFESHKEMHVLFLREEMPAEKLGQLLAAAPEGEHYAVIGRELYCHLPKGVIDSLLGKSFIEKKLKLAVTGRNWRTTEKLATL
ncbi:MAG: DUF1697 domain-containing protein [Pyrinomonadaceae bacterium]|nr:DUF1697 domain-containing protein [Pyrinomonadaceae bacterium]MBP9109945.1 DUF1697 domain-containing protein [Pyrinomonadaceae bacterium]